MEIIVIRPPGDVQGKDIIDPLLATESAGIERGRVELDAQGTIKEIVNLQIVYRTNLKTGQLVEVHDALQGISWKAKITAISHKISKITDPSIFTELTLERPTTFILG